LSGGTPRLVEFFGPGRAGIWAQTRRNDKDGQHGCEFEVQGYA